VDNGIQEGIASLDTIDRARDEFGGLNITAPHKICEPNGIISLVLVRGWVHELVAGRRSGLFRGFWSSHD
jgi:hypothetical protein